MYREIWVTGYVLRSCPLIAIKKWAFVQFSSGFFNLLTGRELMWFMWWWTSQNSYYEVKYCERNIKIQIVVALFLLHHYSVRNLFWMGLKVMCISDVITRKILNSSFAFATRNFLNFLIQICINLLPQKHDLKKCIYITFKCTLLQFL